MRNLDQLFANSLSSSLQDQFYARLEVAADPEAFRLLLTTFLDSASFRLESVLLQVENNITRQDAQASVDDVCSLEQLDRSDAVLIEIDSDRVVHIELNWSGAIPVFKASLVDPSLLPD